MVSRIADPETRGSQGGALPRSCGAAFVGASPYENLRNEADRSQNVL
jgi:hypothetical protein